MTKILVLYYSSWGHMEKMAKAAAEGAREAGADVTIKRVRELVPEDVAKAAYYKLDQEAPIADPLELENYDAIIFGISTRYGAMSAQMKNFFDQTGPLWAKGALVNKVASVMSSTATQHGGAEFARDMALMLDREIGDAAPGIQLIRRGKGVGRADIEAGTAGAAMVGFRIIGLEHRIGEDGPQEEPIAKLAAEKVGMLALPAKPGARGQRLFHQRRGVDKHLQLAVRCALD